MGRYGCDPPVVLLEQMLTRMNEKFGPQDVILLTGDLAAHHVSNPKDTEDSKRTYVMLLDSLGYLN